MEAERIILTYLAQAYFSEDSLTVIASDGIDNSKLATASIFAPEAANSPLVRAAFYNVEHFLEVEFIVPTFDPDDAPLTYFILKHASNALISRGGPGYIYPPNEFLAGKEELLIKVNDKKEGSKTVAITFLPYDSGEHFLL